MPKSIAGRRVGTDSVRGWIDNRGAGNYIWQRPLVDGATERVLDYLTSRIGQPVSCKELRELLNRKNVNDVLCNVENQDKAFVLYELEDEEKQRYGFNRKSCVVMPIAKGWL
jgi:predicted AAA+ superfamily ATPase